MLPWLLFGIPIGGLIDRLDRRLTLAVAGSVRLITASSMSFAIFSHTMTIWWLYVAALIIGTSEVFSDTATQSLIPQVLAKDHIERGNSRVSVAQTVLQSFVGSPLGGALYAAAIWLPFAFNSAAYLVSAGLLLLVPATIRNAYQHQNKDASAARSGFIEDIKVGLKFLVGHKTIFRLVIITASIGFTFAAATSTQVLFLLKVQHVPEAMFGVLMAVTGIAGVFGGLHAPWWSGRFGRSRVLAASIIGSIGCEFATGFSHDIFTFVLLGLINNYLISIWNILLMSTYHELIPNELFGRVHGARRTLVWGMMPIGSLLGGWIATFDLRAPYWTMGGIGMLIAAFSLRFLSSIEAGRE
jgi:MFS family permease